jgi:hypothetical protein
MKFVDEKGLSESIDAWWKEVALGSGGFDVGTLAQSPTRKVRRRAKQHQISRMPDIRRTTVQFVNI